MILRATLMSALLFRLLAAAPSSAELDDLPEHQSARRALQEGLPVVAAIKAERLMNLQPAGSLARQTLAGLAVEAWVRAQNGKAALQILQREKVPNTDFWEAQARVQAGDMDGAEALLARRLQEGSATSQERLLLAQISSFSGNPAQARQVLEPLITGTDATTAGRARLILAESDLREGITAPVLSSLASDPALAEDSKAALLKAQALVRQSRHEEAQGLLQKILGSTSGGEHLHHAASVALADSLHRQGKRIQAVDVLVQFLENTATSSLWDKAFQQLWTCLDGPGTNLPDAVLRWLLNAPSTQGVTAATPAFSADFQGHAMLLIARWLLAQKRSVEALGLLEALIQIHPGHAEADNALKLAMEIYGGMKVESRVAVLAEVWKRRFGGESSARVEFATAGVAYGRGDYRRAMELFEASASLASSLTERRSALYNAGLSAWRAGEVLAFQSLATQLQAAGGGARDGSADLELDQALELAAQARPEAEPTLQTFIRTHAGHPRLFDARLALAETLLSRPKPDFSLVEQTLLAAETVGQLTEKQQQRIALARLWSLESQGRLKTLAESGAAFIQRWPASDSTPLVRMKTADAFFRLENFAAARTEFELVVKEHPSSSYADTALYFAGLSALSMLSDEGREAAINLWQELAERGGPLSTPARQQQALAKRRAGQETEALNLLDSLLLEKKLPEETRRSLLCEKAEILMLLGKTDPAQFKTAVAVLRELLREDDLPLLWRVRGGYTLAVALQSASLPQEALEACYDVVQAAGSLGPATPAEARWYYRAGFFGIDLLESLKQWEPAARLAEKLAVTSGERAAEARERATKIRLEHFLWDGR
ncbi:MAG: hypothetical protein CJBNEKGG_01809 [Prosthecobacter sp.]|nr:hypothetical protein [Prosthecobacter sp.]